jgi:glyoxylase-like metal-dependent hydrolase (beta-lactamase superfamily II)
LLIARAHRDCGMNRQISVSDAAVTGSRLDHATYKIAPDLAYQRQAIVNLMFYGLPGAQNWVLIDAGMIGMAKRIERAAEDRFGEGARPAAIIMTHGHFDHIGSLKHLAEKWDVPIYASNDETPFLNGTSAYPPADPTVGGGMMAALSPLFPRGPFDVSEWLRPLPDNGTVPEMPGWRWLATPGHSPGHISLWREDDRALIAGDAFVTTRQESVYAVAKQNPEVHGPPQYYTPDWDRARDSVRRLADLDPQLVVTGHGPAMEGEEMLNALHDLADNFDTIAVPEEGRYVTH